MQDALRYLEMDSMLSVKERNVSWERSLAVILIVLHMKMINYFIQASFSDYLDLTAFPYETEETLKSNYIDTFQQVKTHSTQK